MTDAIEVRLTWPEVWIAALAGVMRQVAALRGGYQDSHGFEGDGWSEHIVGAIGEMAFCKAYGFYWVPTVNTFKAPDVGVDIEVRARRCHWHELLVRPDDKFERVFVLVTGVPPLLCIRGWRRGTDCQHDEWWHAHGGRPHAWFVPQDALESMQQLKLNGAGHG